MTAYDIKDHGAYDAEHSKLIVQYKHVLEAREQQREKLVELLESYAEVPLLKIKMSNCPQGVITGKIACFLMSLDLLEWDIEKPGEKCHLEAVKE